MTLLQFFIFVSIAALASAIGAIIGANIRVFNIIKTAPFKITVLALIFLLVGAVGSSAVLWAANSDEGWWVLRNRNIEAISSWLSEIIRDFTPWAAIVIFILLIAPVRDGFLQILEGISKFLVAFATRIASGSSFSALGMTLNAEARNLYQHDMNAWTQHVSSQLDLYKEGLDKRLSETVRNNKIVEKLEAFAAQVFALKGTRNRSHGARICVHIRDPHHDGYLYQMTGYVEAGTGYSEKGKSRRFSIRQGIIGQSYRTREFRYDPKVQADDHDALVNKWGFTKKEAAKRGEGRASHAAFPVFAPNETAAEHDPYFIIFFDAKPHSFFANKPLDDIDDNFQKQEQARLESKFKEILKESGLKNMLMTVHTEIKNEPTILGLADSE